MTVWLNGEALAVAADTTVAEVATGRSVPARGVAVAVNGAVVPRARWAATPLTDGARLEILTAVQGG